MKLFNYSFEQSQSFVNEDIVNKLNQKGNWKRYIGLLITSVVLYFFLVAIPMFISRIQWIKLLIIDGYSGLQSFCS